MNLGDRESIPLEGLHCHRCLMAADEVIPQEDGSQLCRNCEAEHLAWNWERT